LEHVSKKGGVVAKSLLLGEKNIIHIKKADKGRVKNELPFGNARKCQRVANKALERRLFWFGDALALGGGTKPNVPPVWLQYKKFRALSFLVFSVSIVVELGLCQSWHCRGLWVYTIAANVWLEDVPE
jgi:hypothetical protein